MKKKTLSGKNKIIDNSPFHCGEMTIKLNKHFLMPIDDDSAFLQDTIEFRYLGYSYWIILSYGVR